MSSIPLTASFVGVDTSTSKSLTLPQAAARQGRVLIIKDRTGNATTNPLTLFAFAGDTFESGATSIQINSNYGSVSLISRANVWLLTSNTQPTTSTPNLTVTYALVASSLKGDGSELTNLNAISSLTLYSTVTGLGTAGYVSSSQLLSTSLGLKEYVDSFIDPVELTSTLLGLGTAGFVSTLNLDNTMTSSLVGLGSAGYISSSQLLSTSLGLKDYVDSFIDPVELTSTLLGLGTAGFVSTLNLDNTITSTVVGLGSAGYVSSSQLLSTSLGLKNYVDSFIDPVELTSTLLGLGTSGFVSTLNLDNTITSTVVGLGSAGYVSTAHLLSTTYGLSQNLTTLNANVSSLQVSSVNTRFGYVSSLYVDEITFGDGQGWADFGVLRAVGLSTQTSWTGLGYATVQSTTALNVSSINGQSVVTAPSLTSTVIGLGSAGYISSSQLQSSLVGINNTSVGGFASTVVGLGTAGYISSSQFLSTNNQNSLVFTTSSVNMNGFSSAVGFVSSLIVNSLQLGFGNAFFNMGDVIATSLSTVQINAGLSFATTSQTTLASTQQLNVSSINGDTVVTATNQTSTVVGLGSAGYVSTSQLLSTSLGLKNYVDSFIDPAELTSTVIGLGTGGFVSTLGLTYSLASTVTGLGTLGFVSTSQLLSTTVGIYQEISASANIITGTNLTSTVAGLGSAGYVSSSQLLSSVAGINNVIGPALGSTMIGLGSAGYVSTTFMNNAITSTVIGLGTAGYASTSAVGMSLSTMSTNMSRNLFVNNLAASTFNVSSVNGVVAYFSTLTVDNLNIGQNAGFISLGDIIVTSASTIIQYAGTTYNTISYTSTINASSINAFQINAQNMVGLLSTINLTSTVAGLGSAGYISSTQLQSTVVGLGNSNNSVLTSTVIGLGSAGYVSSSQLLSSVAGINNVIGPALGSTMVGLGSAGYVSTSQLLSTSLGIRQFMEAFIDPTELTSTVIGLGTGGFVSTLGLTYSLASTVTGLGTLGYVSTSQLLSTTVGVYNEITASANIITGTNLTSTVAGLGEAGYISSSQLLSSVAGINNVIGPALGSTMVGLGSAGYVSSSQLLSSVAGINNVIGPALGSTMVGLGSAGYVSTTFMDNAITSTVIGLGTAGYASTTYVGMALSTMSTNLAISQFVGQLTASTINVSSFTGFSGYFSTLTVDTLNIGESGSGFIAMGDIIVTSVSTIFQQAGITYNTISYTSTANVSSLNAYQINAQNMIGLLSTINLTSTVAGLGSAGYVSSSQLLSSVAGINNVIGPALGSTMIGLGSAGYVSSSQLLSSVAGINNIIGPSLTSTVIGLGSAGYVSSSQLLSSIDGINNVIGPALGSTMVGLGSAGYISSSQLLSSIDGINNVIGPALGSTMVGLGSAGYVSTSQLLSTSLGIRQFMEAFIDPTELTSTVIGLGTGGFVSTLGLTYSLASTVTGLGTLGYVSTSQLLSTTVGVYNEITASANIITGTNLTSTVAGLGSAGYVSSSQLLSSVAGINNVIGPALGSTMIGLGSAGYVSTTFMNNTITSTVIGLGTAGYASTSAVGMSLSTMSTNMSRNLFVNQLAASTLNVSSVTGVVGYFSTLTVDNLAIGQTAGFISLGDIIVTSASTIIQYAGTTYNTISYTSTINASSINAFQINAQNMVGLLSTINLTSTVAGLGSAGYVSSSQLLSTSYGLSLLGNTNLTASLTSTVIGLGTAGYASTTFVGLAISSVSTSYAQQFFTNILLASSFTVSSISGTVGIVSSMNADFMLNKFASTLQEDVGILNATAATTSSFSGNLADALTLMMFDF